MAFRARSCRVSLVRVNFRGVGVALFCALSFPWSAHANPEPPATYDARITGMGGVAVATVDSAAGLFHNPAQLDRIERFALTAVATSLLVNLRAPFAGHGTEQESGLIYAPLLFVGGVGRVHERVSLGVGAYVYTGFGGGFPAVGCISYGDPTHCGSTNQADEPHVDYDPPTSQDVTLFIAELAVPIQVTLIRDVLSVGVTLRMPYGRQSVNATQEAFGLWNQAEQELDGFGVPGVLLGFSYRPIPELNLAASYRSKVWVDMAGITKAMGMDIPTTTRWNVPHAVRVGLAYTTWRERLMLAAEFRVQLHGEANQRQRFDLEGSALVPDTVAEFRWKNVYLGGVAAELRLRPRIPIRVGMTVANSASDPETMTPFSPPPGIMLGVYGGAGVRLGGLEVDFAFGWGGGPAYRKEANGPLCTASTEARDGNPPRLVVARGGSTLTASGGCAGSYDVDSWFLSLSVTYRLGRASEPPAAGWGPAPPEPEPASEDWRPMPPELEPASEVSDVVGAESTDAEASDVEATAADVAPAPAMEVTEPSAEPAESVESSVDETPPG